MQINNKVKSIDFYNKFFLNFIFIILIILTLGLPITSWLSFIIVCFAIVIVITGKLNLNLKKFIIAFFITVISLTLQFYFPKNIQEGFAIYHTDGNEFFESELPEKVNIYLKKTIKENYSVNIPSNEHFSRSFNGWTFSADGFWQKKSMSRMINDINFENVHELRIGAFNDVNMNINYNNWSSYLLRLPLIIKYILPDKFYNADLCFQGLIYIQNEFLNHKQYECIKLDDESLEIYAFDLNPLPNLKIKLISKDIIFKFEKILKLIQFALASVIILILGKISITSISFIFFGMLNYFIYLFDIVFKENLPSRFSTFIFMARGNDGIAFYGYGREILSYLSEGNIYMALRGGVDVFHWMPGLRYFQSICMIFFGETNLGYLLLGFMMPFVIFNLLKKFFSVKMSLILIWIFLCIPIFESFGFLYFYYIKLIVKGFGGSLAWISLLAAISLLLNKKNFSLSKNFISGFSASTLLIIALSCRPNIIPMVVVLIVGFCFFNLFKNNRYKSLGIFLGSLNFFWFAIHNYYFGNEFYLITNSVSNNMDVTPAFWLKFLLGMFSGSINYSLFALLINHIFIWIDYYEIWLMICFLSLFLLLIKKNIKIEIKIISLSLLASHSVFLFYPGSPRYTYGIWMLSFIMMLVLIKEKTNLLELLNQLTKKIRKQFILLVRK